MSQLDGPYVRIHLADSIILPIVTATAWWWGGHIFGIPVWMTLIAYGCGRLSQWIQDGG